MNDTKLHYCESGTRYNFECEENEGKAKLQLCANGEYCTYVKFCPFCGYKAKEYE